LRMLVGVAALLSIGQGVISVLLVVLVATAWGGAAPELGLLTSAQGLGALAGGLLAATLAVRMQPRSLIALGAFGSGALLLVMTNQSTLGVALALYGVIGVMAVALQVGVGTVMQLETPAEYRGRFSSLLSTAGAATTLVAMALTSLLAGIVDVRLMFDVAAVAFLVGGGLAFGRPVLRRIDSPVAVVPRGS